VKQVIPFANASPTGWRQVGRTPFRCLAHGKIHLAAGDIVRFEPVSEAQFPTDFEADPLGGAKREKIE